MRIANDHCDTERLSLKSLGNLRPRKSAHLSWRGELVPVERRVGEQRQICWLVSHYDECVKSDTSPDFSLCDQRIVPSLRPLSQPPQCCGIAAAPTSRGRFGLARVSRGGGAPPYRDALATPPGSRRGQSFLAIAVRIACRQPNKPRCLPGFHFCSSNREQLRLFVFRRCAQNATTPSDTRLTRILWVLRPNVAGTNANHNLRSTCSLSAASNRETLKSREESHSLV